MEKNDIEWFRELLRSGDDKDGGDPSLVLEWLLAMRKKANFKAELIGLDEIRQWYRDESTGDLFHDSGQFFSIQGVRTTAMEMREVSSWDQPIFNQKEGGILALLSSPQDGVMKFLLNAKAEPGNLGTLQLTPTVQCTWSNLNKAHQGKRPPLAEYVMEETDARLVYEADHNEEGGRFWRKSNSTRIYYLECPEAVSFDPDCFIWASLNQIKNLALMDNYLSPFVKTIIAPL